MSTKNKINTEKFTVDMATYKLQVIKTDMLLEKLKLYQDVHKTMELQIYQLQMDLYKYKHIHNK